MRPTYNCQVWIKPFITPISILETGLGSGVGIRVGLTVSVSGWKFRASGSDEKRPKARIPTPVWNTVQRNFSHGLGRNKDIFCLNGENQLVCREINKINYFLHLAFGNNRKSNKYLWSLHVGFGTYWQLDFGSSSSKYHWWYFQSPCVNKICMCRAKFKNKVLCSFEIWILTRQISYQFSSYYKPYLYFYFNDWNLLYF